MTAATGADRAFICETCGAQYTPSPRPPERCAICEDERQYVGWDGQRWTTVAQLGEGHRPDLREEEPGLHGIGMTPSFAIGQRALLIAPPGASGNILWDCIPMFDDEIADRVASLGGIAAIAISHPHFYASMIEWARAFDAPVHLHVADREWVMRPDDHISHWAGDGLDLGGEITLVRLGGHFAGGTVLHWAGGADGRGALLSGDVLHVVSDRRWVSFMRSYPNLIPLPAAVVRRMAAALEPYSFDRIYGAWYGRVVARGARGAVARSAERYVRALSSVPDEPTGRSP